MSTAAAEPANSKMNDDLFTTGPTVNYNPLQKKVTIERLVDTRIPAGQTGALDRAPAGAVQTNDAGQVGGACVWGPASLHVHCCTECPLWTVHVLFETACSAAQCGFLAVQMRSPTCTVARKGCRQQQAQQRPAPAPVPAQSQLHTLLPPPTQGLLAQAHTHTAPMFCRPCPPCAVLCCR